MKKTKETIDQLPTVMGTAESLEREPYMLLAGGFYEADNVNQPKALKKSVSPKTKMSLYLDDKTKQLLDDLYVEAIRAGRKMTYSKIITQALLEQKGAKLEKLSPTFREVWTGGLEVE